VPGPLIEHHAIHPGKDQEPRRGDGEKARKDRSGLRIRRQRKNLPSANEEGDHALGAVHRTELWHNKEAAKNLDDELGQRNLSVTR